MKVLFGCNKIKDKANLIRVTILNQLAEAELKQLSAENFCLGFFLI